MGRPSRFSPEVRERAVPAGSGAAASPPPVGVGGAAGGGDEAGHDGRDAAEVGGARRSVTPASGRGDAERARTPGRRWSASIAS